MTNKEFYKGKDIIGYEYDGETKYISLVVKEGEEENIMFSAKSLKELRLAQVIDFYEFAKDWINNDTEEHVQLINSKYYNEEYDDVYKTFQHWCEEEIEG